MLRSPEIWDPRLACSRRSTTTCGGSDPNPESWGRPWRWYRTPFVTTRQISGHTLSDCTADNPSDNNSYVSSRRPGDGAY